MNIAIILAAGNGSRMGDHNNLPKQFLKVAGKKVIEHTISVFENNVNIDEIAIVCKEDYMPSIEELVIHNQYKKVKKIILGGVERYHSSLSAINAYTDNDNLIFHDAVRPLLNDRIIDECIEALKHYEAVDVAIKSTDTIIQVDVKNCITDIPNRAILRNGQTPQCFKRYIIKKAYDIALNDSHFFTTDDCGVIRKYLPEVPIFVVEGEVFNMKLTYLEDLFLLDKLFQLKAIKGDHHLSARTVQNIPNKVIVVFGGSYGIGEQVVSVCRELGAVVYSFSRSQNNVNITDTEAIKRVLNEINTRNGHIDYIVCTAGLLIKEGLYSMSFQDIQEIINVNYLGIINVAKLSYPFLKESKGSMLLYTSSSYTRGRMLYSIYSSTKAAIVNLVQALSEEWFEFGIRINCINPERTKTPMRVKNFGLEPEESLLDPKVVAIASLNILVSSLTGEVIDVRR